MEEGANGGSEPLADLLNQVQHLTQLVAHLQQQQQIKQAPTTATVVPPKCPIRPLEKFGGNVEEFPAFLAQCKLYIELHAKDFPTTKPSSSKQNLKQGKDSGTRYFIEFKLLAQDLACNVAALMDQYMEGLADEVLDELTRVERPPMMQGLITLCLHIDGRLPVTMEADTSSVATGAVPSQCNTPSQLLQPC
ncbi:UNVERIFIED_CONTAM: hypothetical protein K2H54_033289 [Gekko kuhli]